MRKLLLFIIPAALFLLSSCAGDRLDVDVSSEKVAPVSIKRLDKDLFTLDTNRIVEQSLALQKKYGGFFEKFIANVINDAGIQDSTFGVSLKRFLGDKDMNDVYRRASQIYNEEEIGKLRENLENAFKHVKHYFPDTALPSQVVTMISGFNYGVVNVDSTLAVGLDYYLGKDAPFYDMIQPAVPAYRKRLMEKEYVLADMISGWVIYKFDKNEPERNLMEVMIKAGKLAYCTKAIIPHTEDSVIFGYTSAHMKYLEEYEKNLWTYFADKRLYVNDLKEIVAYTTDGPFTAAISKECPPAVAKYIGYRIVSSYMDNNEKVSVADLMADTDYQKILTKAKYKPR